MAVYSYKAAGASGVIGGTVSAETARQARDQLRARGLRVRDIREVGGPRAGWLAGFGAGLGPGPARWARRPEGKVVEFCRELSTLLQAGIPLLQGLDAILAQQRGGFRSRLLFLREQVAAGASLADAMRRQPATFDNLSVSMVEVGERSGTLDDVLEQLAAFKQRSHQLKGRVATALIYPAIVATAGVAVTVFLMTFVVPRLLAALVEAGQALPAPTRLVKAGSDLLVQRWWLLLLLLVFAAVAVAWLLRVPRVRRAWHGLALRIPLLGDLIRKQTIARVAVTMAALTRSGVEFVVALRIVRQSVGNVVIHDALKRCEDAVAAGRDIAPALEATGVFPATVVQIVDVGQATGRLDQMLDRLATDYDAQVQTATQRMLAVFEPMVILALAGCVLFIVLSVILPYLEAGHVL